PPAWEKHLSTGPSFSPSSIPTHFPPLPNRPCPCHTHAVQTKIQLDASNRIALSRELRRAAGILPKQKFRVSATPGRIVLEMEASAPGHIIKRGKLSIW